jgi:uncharacterized membrane protein YidH (DUF202 family)
MSGLRAALAVVVAAVGVVLAASSATAQTITTTQNASGVESPIGGYVFLGVSAVILGTALVLYLQHRTPKSRRPPAAAPDAGPADAG